MSNRPIYDPWNRAFEDGGWLCSSCGQTLSHKDMLGKKIPGGFTVRGYVCPACRHRHPEVQGALKPFSWPDMGTGRSLAASRPDAPRTT
ncbi:MAG: hypothetical protein LUQ25_05250 [Methanoregulaceae archaeon]|nr:hypothetical protein [Methanoregulaceae archaeon]